MRRLQLLVLMIGLLRAAEARSQTPILTPLDSGLYVHTSYQVLDGAPFPSNGLVILTKDSAVLIDSGWGDKATRDIVRSIQRTLHRPVAACISTHFHEDRTGGVRWLRKHGICTYATQATRRLARENKKPCPEHDLAEDTLLTFDGVQIQVWYPGPGHAPDNIVVWLPKERVLFGGCLVKSLEAQGLGYTGDADVHAWPRTIEAVQRRFPDVRVVVPGHQAWGDRSLLDHTLQLLRRP